MMSTAPTGTRSLLEEMLESLKQRDGKAKDAPPALPSRPPSRGRLPSARRSLPLNFKIEDGEGTAWKGVQDLVFGGGIFGRKRMAKTDQPEESPYFNGSNCSGASSPSSAGRLKATDYASNKKLRVWCQPKGAKWELGKIQSIAREAAEVKLCDGKIMKVSKENLLPANPDVLDGVDDLIRLSYLNEPSVLHNLKCRYTHDLVYTKAGPVLLAINPFKKVALYGNDLIAAYKQKTIDHPHVYSIADAAFGEMMRAGTNQSIIISGESGAGKSETAKAAMEYLAVLGSGNGLAHEVMQTIPILEAFGNAKTSRNDNSSRFGKLTEMHFNTNGRICGAKIQTFLLEKSRVVQRGKGERSYHVFYQLCAGAPLFLKEKLDLRSADAYEYLKQSGCLTIDDVDDAERFHMLMEAFDTVQISKEDQHTAFTMLATVLWLGNIAFSTVDNESHVEVVFDEGVTNVAKLLACEVHDLMLALSTCKVQGENGTIIKKLTLSEAIDARDALAQSIYASLFDWLVERINMSFEVGKSFTGKSISILDIYGFQSFQKNSFEQFCINYANERLQQHFTRHLLKLEQEEYIQDGIDWTSCDFMDNIECLNLFEKKPVGLFAFLDEESTRPKSTDQSFANKIKEHLNGNPCFKGERSSAFRIHHYAGEVSYNTNGFLEKNRGPRHSDSIQLLLSSGCRLPHLLLSQVDQTQNPSTLQQSTPVDSEELSVGTRLKGQVFNLMQQLEKTTPHFIRCIKPNNEQLPGMYENEYVLQQLRCCGVLEVVRISRSGYPTRMTHQQFSERFGFLLLENIESQDPLSDSVAILQQFHIPPEMYQVGYTKIFFRTGQIAALEDIRNRAMRGALWAQKRIRGLHARRHYQDMKKGATTIQSFIRGDMARRELQKHVKRPITRIMFGDNQKDTDNMQSEISPNRKKANRDPSKNHQQKKDHVKESKPSASTELQSLVLKAEEALSQKDEEIATLQHQIQQYKTRCSDYEAKIKTNDEMWQKQVTSLQVSLAAAKKSLPDSSPTQHDYDSESGISTASRTPQYTPPRQPHASNVGQGRDSGGNQNAVGNLVKEFEDKTQGFEDDARQLMDSKSGQAGNSREEIRKLKTRFVAWKKDYRARLREAKTKLGGSVGEKRRRKWWGKRCSKA